MLIHRSHPLLSPRAHTASSVMGLGGCHRLNYPLPCNTPLGEVGSASPVSLSKGQ